MQPTLKARHVVLFILHIVKSYPAPIVVMFLVAGYWSVEISLRPYILKIILNQLTTSSRETIFADTTFPAIAFVLLSFFGATIFRFYGYFVAIKMIPSMRKKIAEFSFDKLLSQSHHFYQNQFAGNLTNKVNDLTSSIPDIIQVTIDRFFSHSLALIFAIFTLWQVSYQFAILMLSWSMVFILGSLLLSNHMNQLADDWSEWGSTITGKVVDVLTNFLPVRLFARKIYEKTNLDQTLSGAAQAERKLQWGYFWIWFVYSYLFVTLQAVNLYLLLKGRQAGWITIGDFALVLTLNIAIVDFLWSLTHEFSNFSRAFGKATQALRVVLNPPDINDAPNAVELKVSKGKIVFDHVGFNYHGSSILFNEKSVTIPAGQKVGLVGYSGSGKTTFVHLILRLYDVTSGSIFIDNHNIQMVTQDSLHQSIGMIPQDPTLFHRTLLENIRYGKIDATDDQVMVAAQKAHADSFITQIPQGYQALVGERGVKLSGGQRQRISIARVILKNAPILILDEATSQLDSLTENDIQKSLWELMHDKTTLVIAHRLSTLLHMDRILVFDQGKIIEDGTHPELLSKKGLYKTMWDTQIGGFLPDKRMQ